MLGPYFLDHYFLIDIFCIRSYGGVVGQNGIGMEKNEDVAQGCRILGGESEWGLKVRGHCEEVLASAD